MNSFESLNFKGKKVLMRVDFNVPLDDNFHISDDTRIRAAIPSIKKILSEGGSVILMSHLGRPKSGPEAKFSLKHIIPGLEKTLNQKVQFVDDCINANAQNQAQSLKAGEVLLLENLRFYKEEEAGDEGFAKSLASLADFYVNDAFGTAHRAHASTAIIAKFFPNHKSFGYLIENEINGVNKILKDGQKPILAVVGGAKVSSKIDIIENMLDKIDRLIVGGGMAYTFVKALGGNIGNSLVEESHIETALALIEKCKSKQVELFLPIDTQIAESFSNDVPRKVCNTSEIPDGWMGLDIGPKSIEKFTAVITSSKTMLWNGPMGVFEFSSFQDGTKKIGEAMVEATKNGAFSLVGGGDSVSAANQFGLAENLSYISTGGGALLEYLEGKELPGISAILN